MTTLAKLDDPTLALYSMHAAGETAAGATAEHELAGLVAEFTERTTLHGHLSPPCIHWLGPSSGLWMSQAARSSHEWFAEELCRQLGEIKVMPLARLFGEISHFPEPTPSVLLESIRTTPDLVVSSSPETSAFQAFKDLGLWLHADDATVADMVGVGRTTPYTWKRGGEPRTGTAQRVYEYRATIDSLRRRLGPPAFGRWLHEGSPSRREVLLQGDLESLEGDVHAVLFRRARDQRVDLAAEPDAPAVVDRVDGELRLRPSGRRPRRSSG